MKKLGNAPNETPINGPHTCEYMPQLTVAVWPSVRRGVKVVFAPCVSRGALRSFITRVVSFGHGRPTNNRIAGMNHAHHLFGPIAERIIVPAARVARLMLKPAKAHRRRTTPDLVAGHNWFRTFDLSKTNF